MARLNLRLHGVEIKVDTAQMLSDGKEWDRRASIDSQDSMLFSSLRSEPLSSLTFQSSIHIPRPPPLLLETASGFNFNTIDGQNGRVLPASITADSAESASEKEADHREVILLRERLSAVEEALQLMRDEARTRTTSVEAADISFVRLLGRGSFAEVLAIHSII